MFHKTATRLLLAALICGCLGSAAAAQKTTTVNVTSTVHDYDNAANLLLLRSDDLNGYQQATYTTVRQSHGSGYLVNSFVTNGQWQLTISSQSGRSYYITPNQGIDNTQPAGPPAGYYTGDSTGAELHSHCFDQNGNIVPLGNVLTSSGNCQFGVTFISAGTRYKLLMSPFPFTVDGSAPATCPSTGCPPTGVVTVTCNAVSSGQCVSWTITPNTSAPHANVAGLYRYQTSGRSATWVFIGQYYNTFRIDVAQP